MEAGGYVSLEETKEYKCIVDQTFTREEDFYEFYNDYAYHKGFNIRKGRVRYKTGTKEVIWRRLMCSCEGYRSVKYFERMDKKRQPRALTRCGCTARLDVEWSESIGIWWTMNAKSAFPTEMRTNTHVWTEQMDRYHSLRSKGNRALFKVSRSQGNDIWAFAGSFSAANQPGGTKVLDPVKIVSKGAPRSNKRWKASHEFWETV
uniref:FAR1 domain-containing protein n=1 Tax=Setaria viridis TaxID=4556 RepID=A0A4U6UJG6_SETVI|nr:hypothetical protein SEVIR_5G300000v2 [Setaria viridis]